MVSTSLLTPSCLYSDTPECILHSYIYESPTCNQLPGTWCLFWLVPGIRAWVLYYVTVILLVLDTVSNFFDISKCRTFGLSCRTCFARHPQTSPCFFFTEKILNESFDVYKMEIVSFFFFSCLSVSYRTRLLFHIQHCTLARTI